MTTVWACEKTVVMLKQPGHLTSMKKERGAGTSICGGREDYFAILMTVKDKREAREIMLDSFQRGRWLLRRLVMGEPLGALLINMKLRTLSLCLRASA